MHDDHGDEHESLGRWKVGRSKGWEGATLLGLLLFVGAGAVYGGIGLMVDGMGMQLSWLDRLPVDTSTWPGVALLATVALPSFPQPGSSGGATPAPARSGASGRNRLVVWILVQLALLQRYFFLQPVVAGIGLAELGVSLLWVRRSTPRPS